LGPTGLSNVALQIGSNLHKMQSGAIYHYTLVILIGITVLFGLRQIFYSIGFLIDFRLFVLIVVVLFFLLNN